MPDIEISPSITRTIVEGAETLAKSPAMKRAFKAPIVGKALEGASNVLNSFADKTFSIDNIATGESGANVREWWGNFKKQQAFHEQRIAQQNIANKTEQLKYIVKNQAKRAARKDLGGHNDANIVKLVADVKAEHGPMKAARIANHLQQMLGDEPFTPTKFSTLPSGKVKAEPDYGKTTGQLRYNIMRNKGLAKELDPLMDLPEKQSDIARELGAAYGVSHAVLAKYAAPKHLTQFVMMFANTTSLNTGLMTLRAGFGAGRDGAIGLMKFNHAGGEFFTDIQADMHKYKTGQIKDIKWLSPEVGQWLSKNVATATPGMRGLRDRLVPMAAAKGYYEAIEAIQKLIADPKDRAAQVNLQYLGIKDWQSAVSRYAANGNVIHKVDARTAMDTSIFQRAFHNNEIFRSHFSQSQIGRYVTTYHWVGQNIKRGYQREIMRAFYSRNPIQIASTLAILGVAYPEATWAIHKGLALLRGQPQPTPEEHAKRFFNNMNLLTDMTGWGVEYGIINSAVNRELADHEMGGQISRIIRTTEDLAAGAKGKAMGQKHAMWPLYRDLLESLPYGAGDLMAHHYFPTRAEIQAAKPMTTKRIAAKRAAEKRKANEKARGE